MIISCYWSVCKPDSSSFFFFNDTATTEIYTLSLHDALPIYPLPSSSALPWPREQRSRHNQRRIDHRCAKPFLREEHEAGGDGSGGQEPERGKGAGGPAASAPAPRAPDRRRQDQQVRHDGRDS